MLGWLVRLAIHTGMRAGELRSLRHDQVDLKRRVVTLSMTKNGSARTVPLTQAALAVFELAINNPARPHDCDLIFFGEPGRNKTRRPYEFRPAWQQVVKDHNITRLRFHDLRHEAVSRLIEAGLGDQEVAAISGHKSMQMLRRYTHLRAEDLVAKLDQLGSAATSPSSHLAMVLRDSPVIREISRSDFFPRRLRRRILPIMSMVITPLPLLLKNAAE